MPHPAFLAFHSSHLSYLCKFLGINLLGFTNHIRIKKKKIPKLYHRLFFLLHLSSLTLWSLYHLLCIWLPLSFLTVFWGGAVLYISPVSVLIQTHFIWRLWCFSSRLLPLYLIAVYTSVPTDPQRSKHT